MASHYATKNAIIKVEKLRLRSYIGFVDWEKQKLQDVVISFSFTYDTSLAILNDDVEKGVDYKKITKDIILLVDNQRFHLIETMAERIYEYIASLSCEIQDTQVKVEKPNALRFCDNVHVTIDSKDRYKQAVIALGSNIDSEANFKSALNLLQHHGKIAKRTDFITTTPLKFEYQADFLNGAILFYTKDNLSDLKLSLLQIEAMLGRVRSANKNAPRTIDLDILTFNDFLVDKEIAELPFLIDFVRQLQPDLAI